jgi:hypothetical protein
VGFKDIVYEKIRSGQYTAVKEKASSYTIYLTLHWYWFFPGNPDFHKFKQHRIANGGFSTRLGLFMKAYDHARASAISTHKIPVVSGLQVSDDELENYMANFGKRGAPRFKIQEKFRSKFWFRAIFRDFESFF